MKLECSKFIDAVAYICGDRTQSLNATMDTAIHFCKHIAPKLVVMSFDNTARSFAAAGAALQPTLLS